MELSPISSMDGFPFKKYAEMKREYIDFSYSKLIHACSITPIDINDTIDNLMNLQYKFILQSRIICNQHEQLIKIIQENYLISDYIKFPNDEELNIIENIDHTNCDRFMRYNDLDLVTLFEKYKNIISDDPSSFIRHLVVTSIIQRTIVKQQQNAMIEFYKTGAILKLNGRSPTEIIQTYNALHSETFNYNSPEQILFTKQLIAKAKQLFSEPEPQISNKKPKKRARRKKNKTITTNIPKTEQSPNDCCICFSPIEQKIALIPCGHTNICEKCVIDSCGNKCPICRVGIEKYVKVFL